MKTGTCLALLAIGAILAFAIRGHPSFLNVQVAGVVIMIIGAAGLVLPGRGSAWLRRQVIRRRGPAGQVVGRVVETRTPSYVMLDPAAVDRTMPYVQPSGEEAAVMTETVPAAAVPEAGDVLETEDVLETGGDLSDTADLPAVEDNLPDHADRVRRANREVVVEEYFGDLPE
ncbi:MAG TPA: hypothetical protein DEH11_17115 [Actinobacteria bacterium]|jgi:hypothetical protein|nr:hypothetical protein [Actinomycetota bacterium]